MESATAKILVGKTKIAPKTWHHLALVREGRQVVVYLDGNPKPEISARQRRIRTVDSRSLSVGGRGDGLADFEGKIDEVALFDRRSERCRRLPDISGKPTTPSRPRRTREDQPITIRAILTNVQSKCIRTCRR